MVLLKARHNAQIDLAFGTMIFGLPTEYPAVGVNRVPAVIAA